MPESVAHSHAAPTGVGVPGLIRWDAGTRVIRELYCPRVFLGSAWPACMMPLHLHLSANSWLVYWSPLMGVSPNSRQRRIDNEASAGWAALYGLRDSGS